MNLMIVVITHHISSRSSSSSFSRMYQVLYLFKILVKIETDELLNICLYIYIRFGVLNDFDSNWLVYKLSHSKISSTNNNNNNIEIKILCF